MDLHQVRTEMMDEVEDEKKMMLFEEAFLFGLLLMLGVMWDRAGRKEGERRKTSVM